MAQHPTSFDIDTARRALAAADPLMAKAESVLPPVAWRVRPPGFASLALMIVEQQVSVAAAASIWRKVEAGLGGAVTVDAVLAADDAALRAFGLSGQKARYLKAIAEARDLFDDLDLLDDDQAMARLTAIKGVGPWTAEIYLMFSEGRTDLFPAADLALQEGFRLLEGSAARPDAKAMYARAEAWRPYRGVAALLLWAYYSAVKRGEITADAT